MEWTMRAYGVFIRSATFIVLSILLASCATLFTTAAGSYNISGIEAEGRSNGYVFTIEAAGKIGRVPKKVWIISPFEGC